MSNFTAAEIESLKERMAEMAKAMYEAGILKKDLGQQDKFLFCYYIYNALRNGSYDIS